MTTENFVTVDLHCPAKYSPPPKKSKLFLKNVVGYFREYCEATSIHGFRYFGESRTVYEKIWWFTVFIICLILCILSILTVYKKWDLSPVIVTFATRGKPICDIPFPAVTICLESKVDLNVFDYTSAISRKKQGINFTEQEEMFLGYLSYVCNNNDDFDVTSLNYTDTDNIFNVIEEVTPKFSIINCKYLNIKKPCDFFFTPIITDDGICYTFNILDRTELFNDDVVHYSNFHNVGLTSEHWSMENGYTLEAGVMPYPKRAFIAGARYGFTFELKIPKGKIDKMCREAVDGYKILFHAPMRLPRPMQQYIRVPYDRAVGVAIRPSQILTSEAVKGYSAKKRQCYFNSEKKLKYFRVYSLNNCNTECLTNYTLEACQCVLFYMPRENSTRICGAQDYACTIRAEYELQAMRVYNRINFKDKHFPEVLKKHICHCMPMCSDIDYSVATSQSDWNLSEDLEANETTSDNNTDYHLSKVIAYFISGNFIGSERNELYGPTDFLANFGGLLGLFTGFSILSLTEIIYFLTVRLIANLRLYGHWAGHKK